MYKKYTVTDLLNASIAIHFSLLLIFIVKFNYVSMAQPACLAIGNSAYESGNTIIEIDNGDIVAAGNAGNASEMNICRLDSSMNLIWSKLLKSSNGQALRIFKILKSTDANILVLGSKGTNNPVLAKIDYDGNAVWLNELNPNTSVLLTDMFQSPVSSLITLVGYYNNNDGWGFLIVKINNDGTLVSAKGYKPADGSAYGKGLIRTPEGGYLYVGSSNDGALMFKIGTVGNFQWGKRINAEVGAFRTFTGISYAENGGYYITGIHRPNGNTDNDGFLLKLDNTYGVLWRKKVKGYELAAPVLSSDNSLYCAAIGERMHILKWNATGGVLWERRMKEQSISAYDKEIKYPIGMALTPNLVAGEDLLIASGTNLGSGGNDMLISKIRENGGNCSLCFDQENTTFEISDLGNAFTSINVSLNNVLSIFSPKSYTSIQAATGGPASYICNVYTGLEDGPGLSSFPLRISYNNGYPVFLNLQDRLLQLEIFDLSGKKVYEFQLGPFSTFETDALAPTLYFVREKNKKGALKFIGSRN